MKLFIKQATIASVLIAVFSHSVLADDKEHSGYLGKEYYDKMDKVKLDSGLKAKRWASDSFSSADYNTAIVDDVVFYPDPEPSDQVSAELLQEMKAYLTKELRAKIGSKVTLVNKPQKGAVRVSAALTGVVTDNENMKPYEIIPVAAIFAIATTATGHRDQEVHVFLEAKVTDSMTGETLVALVREIEGKKLKNKAQQLKMDHVQGDLDKISSDAETSLSEYVN